MSKNFFLSPNARHKKPRDPLDGFTIPVDRSGPVLDHVAVVSEREADSIHTRIVDKAWSPPVTAVTFSEYGIEAARRLCASKPQVIIREDPMFGRRGYAREVLADPAAPRGYLVLVIAYASRKDTSGRWVEPVKPKSCDRQYWAPTKVEFTSP